MTDAEFEQLEAAAALIEKARRLLADAYETYPAWDEIIDDLAQIEDRIMMRAPDAAEPTSRVK